MGELLFDNYVVFLLIFARISGMILFNPIFGRRNLPAMVKLGLSFFLSLILTGVLPADGVKTVSSLLIFLLICVKELFLGFLIGCIMQMFLAVLLLAGDYADLQLGVGLSKIYDPQSNLSMPVTGSVLNLFYMVFFFISNGHLTFVKLMTYTFSVFPPGAVVIGPKCGEYAVLLFSEALVLSVKLALPIVAVEIITELGLGILMRTVPQINLFAVGMQLKLLVGLVMILLILPGFFHCFDALTGRMFESIQTGIRLMGQ